MNLLPSYCSCPVLCQPCGVDNEGGSGGEFCATDNGDCPDTYSVTFSVVSVTDPVYSFTVPAYSGSHSPTAVSGNKCRYRFDGVAEAVTVTASGVPDFLMDRRIVIELMVGASAPFLSFSSPCAESNGGTISSACYGINVVCALGYYQVGSSLLRFQHTKVFALKANDIEDDCSQQVPCYTGLSDITPHWTAEYPSGLNGTFGGIT